MKNRSSLSVYGLLLACLSISWLSPSKTVKPSSADSSITKSIENNTVESKASQLYTALGLEEKGLSKDAFEYAYKGYNKLIDKHIIKRPELLTICDFSQSSNNKRLYIVNLNSNELVVNTYVAHGRNSGGEFATKFSNKMSSLQSSLGFYITQNTYFGEHGLSLKVSGLEAGYNDKAYSRAIVVHGAGYIGGSWLSHSSYMGRSYGCPAIPENEKNLIINTIKNGTCLFIYHPSKNYLKGSKLLNG
ncbi:MAG: murein L,D-transpeptidase catalytic domain family protein [Chitinophagaceae bacterium]